MLLNIFFLSLKFGCPNGILHVLWHHARKNCVQASVYAMPKQWLFKTIKWCEWTKTLSDKYEIQKGAHEVEAEEKNSPLHTLQMANDDWIKRKYFKNELTPTASCAAKEFTCLAIPQEYFKTFPTGELRWWCIILFRYWRFFIAHYETLDFFLLLLVLLYASQNFFGIAFSLSRYCLSPLSFSLSPCVVVSHSSLLSLFLYLTLSIGLSFRRFVPALLLQIFQCKFAVIHSNPVFLYASLFFSISSGEWFSFFDWQFYYCYLFNCCTYSERRKFFLWCWKQNEHRKQQQQQYNHVIFSLVLFFLCREMVTKQCKTIYTKDLSNKIELN